VTAVVVDASVAGKWLLPAQGETLVDQSFRLLGRWARGESRLIVPDLFWAELGNLLWKAVRQGRYAMAAAEAALGSLKEGNLATVSSLTLLDQAFGIANTFDRTVYDSLYVALALESKAELITADEKLANELAARLPVKWLGAI
jgi:predicted nucleic acid-binding protein